MNKSKLEPYLCFNGNCKEAMEFYQSVLGGKLEISTFGDYASAEMPVADEQKDKVMHATLNNDLLSFMASDSMPDRPVEFGGSISMSIAGTDEGQLKGFFKGLSEGGKVTLPLAKQVWGDQFGMLTDKYDIQWMINIGTEETAAKNKAME